MEQLQDLLKNYNRKQIADFSDSSWANQYCEEVFPSYWKYVFAIAYSLPKTLRIVEIGAGYGFVTSIFIYLRFLNITGFEQDFETADTGNRYIKDLFGAKHVIKPIKFKNQNIDADVLLLVNCAYSDGCTTKEEYKNRLIHYFKQAGCPQYYILEVIDDSYVEKNDEFPMNIRLNRRDIENMFLNSKIQFWRTYQYPRHEKSKTLYLIETT